MEHHIKLILIIQLFSCETSNMEVQVKGGEVALGNNKGSKFYIAPDENVEIVKKLKTKPGKPKIDIQRGLSALWPDS